MFFIKKHYVIGTIICSLISQTAFARDIYRNEDPQGRITYSDIATTESKKIKLSPQTYRYLHQVTKIYDGDTIVLENGQRVRLLGINTPEIESRYRKSEPGGIAAKKWLQRQLRNKKVYLEFDQEKYDRYKRLLAHVYLPNGQHLNTALVENGLAVLNLIPPNLRHAGIMLKAQQRAEELGLGIWSISAYKPRPLTQISEKTNGWQRYTGIAKSIKHSRKYSRLIFNHKMDIRIANDSLPLFPELKTYLGKSLEIRGWISRKKDHYSIRIHHPSAILFR
ncbi:Endonuclease YncB, thermonuclease family [Nitrosomonas cryotolerans]|uniref:Endonuclease YncB, thermonuclease family n=1 Tax=Nitrosomonas cryotolerans ATCC 49181 TaxID=1131553 RepID=A0A1N6J616_9PROT|nr:thermonuclease family protein [Nitrosomonas cryotolerans]SFP45638.1 Endonuclease YncB, thermonuclease family [Nitrosomonas cryotolerans]SIO39750.1 Endonuclease YncB, thermonuclease family [Nitrosomonas cryotolerans ATCC 49181]